MGGSLRVHRCSSAREPHPISNSVSDVFLCEKRSAEASHTSEGWLESRACGACASRWIPLYLTPPVPGPWTMSDLPPETDAALLDRALEAPPEHISFRDVDMSFGSRHILKGLTCSFPRSRLSVVLGGSGVGKSTLLRLIGGLVRPQSGSIEIAGEETTRFSEGQLYGVRKKIGMLFQNGALLDSETVFDNIAFPLREHTDLGPNEVEGRVHQCLEAVGLHDVDRLFPAQLSGGMTRRVGLARAMVRRPDILLCDEPFSGLDPISAKRIELLLCELNRKHGLTVIAVSHDIASTLRMAHHLVMLFLDQTIEGTVEELQTLDDDRVRNFLSLEIDEALGEQEGEVERLNEGNGAP